MAEMDKYYALFEHAPIPAVMSTVPENTLIDVNLAFEQMFGLKARKTKAPHFIFHCHFNKLIISNFNELFNLYFQKYIIFHGIPIFLSQHFLTFKTLSFILPVHACPSLSGQ
jgi:hypothetical protein